MPRLSTKAARLKEAKELLRELGLPAAQQNERSGWVLLALAGIKPSDSNWEKGHSELQTTRQIMDFIRDTYGRNYAANSRETIRRQTLHQFEQAAIVIRNADNPERATNSGNNNYSLSPSLAGVLENYPTGDWKSALKIFQEQVPTLQKTYLRSLNLNKINITLPDNVQLKLSPGRHNQLHAEVVSEFLPRFAKQGKVIYLGDTASSREEGGKMLILDSESLASICLHDLGHDKLPDLIFLDTEQNWLFLIEAVTSHGPISEKRFIELKKQFKGCTAGLVFVTAFPDQKTFRRFAADIAWETEVWIADRPDHLIHFNGDRFLGPR